MDKATPKPEAPKKAPSPLLSLLKPYSRMIILLILFALISNGVNLLLPMIISHGIDEYTAGKFVLKTIVIEFLAAALFIFVFTYLQSIIQTYASERVAKDLRTQLADKISRQSFAYIQQANPSRLLTNLTSDIDSVKTFVSQAVVSIVSSLCIIIGASILLLSINWKLGLTVLAIVPIVGITFYVLMRKVRTLFKRSREVVDWLNKVINESVLGSALIRVINSQQLEYDKFLAANTDAKDLGLAILRLFAALIPVISFTANMAALSILVLGGHFVITGSMSLGDFAAFSSYLSLLIFPIIMLGFMSNVIAQASASYERVNQVLQAPETVKSGTIDRALAGDIDVRDVAVNYDGKPALKDVSFSVKAGTQTAIVGPTAAGKSQLLYLLTGLINTSEGSVEYDGQPIDQYNEDTFHQQVGFVFQDSIIFNMSLRENIAFSDTVTDELLDKAIDTAELRGFIDSLPQKLQTVVSERGASLSGGQKQRIMLARALALNPKVLLLDDFTARVDTNTEQKIVQNIQKNYPGLTLISVTQKIASIEDYEQIILLMEGEIIAKGTHPELMSSSPEYVQIYQSQRSTSQYELRS
ncbi:ABC transporter ATP-binding protein [Spirosoma endbachense]|uniref:ATP-binding cassette domain-containing protein n=1 Tax=Spirosoma endbachense TaxID=2666025 RepID=A0A6P1W356_9BACT|nr:ABC transporter ATP-binding protein [Spirosoma endbachense]QHV99853.1 ATP-binding cassette domain-containing protein [Spirosoma endbachense]